MDFFQPYSKADQLKGHQREKRQPKLIHKKPRKKRSPKKNTNIEMFHGRKVPHWKQRGAVQRKEANEALRHYGEACAVCGNHEYHLHHIVHKGFGIGGRGVWRNLVPLCEYHHTGDGGVHKNPEHDNYWKELHRKKFGEYFFCDRWDLWMKGLIENPTEELFERFMEEEQERMKGERNAR